MITSKILLEDVNEIISDAQIHWCDLKDSTILVTGATGMIGSAIIRTLFAVNEQFNINIKILALGRDNIKAEYLIKNYNVYFIKNDICKIIEIDENINYIFHCAANTKSSDRVKYPVDVMTSIVDGTSNILELSREKQIKSIVFLSSKDIYGQYNGEVYENNLGYIDLSDTTSSYPESKRYCEMLCHAYFIQYNIPIKIARL